jgi:hypothetical protein
MARVKHLLTLPRREPAQLIRKSFFLVLAFPHVNANLISRENHTMLRVCRLSETTQFVLSRMCANPENVCLYTYREPFW